MFRGIGYTAQTALVYTKLESVDNGLHWPEMIHTFVWTCCLRGYDLRLKTAYQVSSG